MTGLSSHIAGVFRSDQDTDMSRGKIHVSMQGKILHKRRGEAASWPSDLYSRESINFCHLSHWTIHWVNCSGKTQ